MNKQLLEKWISVVFDDTEHACMGPYYAKNTQKIKSLYITRPEYVTINPLLASKTRSALNVTAFRTFLIESDEDFEGKEVDKTIQIQKTLVDAKMPWSTMTDSSNKSIHFLICLKEPLKDQLIYTAYFKAIEAALKKHGVKIDDKCKDAARFTRAPYGTNTKTVVVEKKPKEEDRLQKILRVNKRIDLTELDQWLADNGIKATDFIETPTLRAINMPVSEAPVDWKLEVLVKNWMANDQYVQGNKNAYQYKLAWLMFGAGCTRDQIEMAFKKHFDKIDERKPIESAEKAQTKCNPIYIATKEEQKAYYKKLQEQQTISDRRNLFERDGIKVDTIGAKPESINRYFIVGTEYFKTESLTDNFIPWTKAMFEKIYGSSSLPPKAYDYFGYEPDYMSAVVPRELDVDKKRYNIFIRPNWKFEPGDWSNIEAALRHGFGEQYELILEYCAILLAYPKAKLPALWFLGPEDTGKSAVIAVFIKLLGEKVCKKISNSKLEGDYTDFLGGSQLVIVEEAGNFKNPQKVMDDLKDWITEHFTQNINPKYGKQFDSAVHCKFVFSSNNADAFALNGDATRFWPILIDKKPKTKISNYYQVIEKEMGHFAYYLKTEIVPKLRLSKDDNNKMVLDTTHRLYFDPKQYENEIKLSLKSLNRSELAESLHDELMEFFTAFKDEEECFVDLKSIKYKLNTRRFQPGNKEIKKCLMEEFKLQPTNLLTRPDHFYWIQGNDIEKLKPERRSQWYVFNRKNFIGEGENIGSELLQTQYF